MQRSNGAVSGEFIAFLKTNPLFIEFRLGKDHENDATCSFGSFYSLICWWIMCLEYIENRYLIGHFEVRMHIIYRLYAALEKKRTDVISILVTVI